MTTREEIIINNLWNLFEDMRKKYAISSEDSKEIKELLLLFQNPDRKK